MNETAGRWRGFDGRHRFCGRGRWTELAVPVSPDTPTCPIPPTISDTSERAWESPMRRLLRWRVVLPIVVAIVVGAIVGVKLYSRSDAVARLVGEKLRAKLGTAAQFDKLSVGVSSTSLSDLKVYEQGADSSSQPFLAAGEVDLNVGAVGAASGKEPTEIHFRDTQVLLRFNKAGDLMTQLPKAGGEGGNLPTIRIESGTLTIRQEGRDDSVFSGIDLTVSETDNVVKVAGTVEDKAWGKWSGEGTIPVGGQKQAGKLVLKTLKPQFVNPDLLRHVPFVNPNAWKHVGLSGNTPARVELDFDAATEKVDYHVSLEPTATTVDVPSIGLHFTGASGSVMAEAGVVTLTDVHGKAADGEVRLDSRMDFNHPTDTLRFAADLTNMDVRQLPKQWKLPSGIDGRLTGKLEFTVTLPPGSGTRVEALGKATIAQARLRGRPIPPVELEVQSGGEGGINFNEKSPDGGRHEVRKFDDPKQDEPRPEPKAVPGRRPGIVSSVLKLAARVVKPANAPPEEKAYLHINVAFRDVDLAELLKTAGVEVPVKLGGKVTVQVQVDIPTDTPDEFKAYRLSGTIKSRRVTVDELALESLSAQVDFRDGRLSVKDFVGKLPGFSTQGGEPGSFQAQGNLDVGKSYRFNATVKLEKVPLESVGQLTSLLPASLHLSGEASVHANLEGTLSPLGVKSNGDARVKRLRAGTIPADDLTFRWESDDEAIHFKDASGKLFGGEVSGSLDVPIKENAAGSGSLKLTDIDLGELSKSLMEGGTLRLEGKAAGTITLRSPAAGEGERGATADIDLQAPSMKLQGIPAKKIKGTAAYRGGVLKYTLTGEALGGSFEVAGQYPPPKKEPPKVDEKKGPPKKEAGLDLGRIKLRGMRLSKLWDLVGLKASLGQLDADISGDFPLSTDDDGRLIGTGRLRADRLRWGGKDIASTGQAIVRLTSTEMTFEEITFFVGEGVARARAVFHRTDPERSHAALTITNVPAGRLLFLLPDLAGRIDVPLDGRLTTTMGREWRGSGVLTASRGKIMGVPVSDVRLPMTWVSVPGRGRSEFRLRDMTASAAGGQFAGSVSADFYNDLPPRLDGTVQFKNVNLSAAFRDAGRVIGNLPVSGTLDLGAQQYRGPGDLTANLRATLGESQPLALPVLSALVPYLGYGRDTSTTIQGGEFKAALGNGVWRVTQLSLTGSSLSLFADGTVTTGGRLNLNVVATSRSSPAQAVLQRFNPLTAAVLATPARPLNKALLADAVSMIGTYVMYIEVGGTVDSPIVRVNTLRTLTEDAARFFVLRFVNPVPIP
jgi:hypothetical protein